MPSNFLVRRDRRAAEPEEARRARLDRHNVMRRGRRLANFQAQRVELDWHQTVNSQTRLYHLDHWNRNCRFCGVLLLTGEREGWCCSNGSKMTEALPPNQEFYNLLAQFPGISTLSLRINRLFTFSATGVSQGAWIRLNGPSTVVLSGRTYHRMLPFQRDGNPLAWYLHDANDRAQHGVRHHIPQYLQQVVSDQLFQSNPYIGIFRQWIQEGGAEYSLEIVGDVASGEIAALWRPPQHPRQGPRSAYIHRLADARAEPIDILSPLYEPLAYPLFWPSGGLGWTEQRRFFGHR
jgi:hypothetical protein